MSTTCKKPARSCRYDADTATITVCQGKETARYRVESLDHDFGPTFACYRLSKAGGDEHDVCLDLAGGHGQCDCLGALRWGHRQPCRHVSMLFALRNAGKLE